MTVEFRMKRSFVLCRDLRHCWEVSVEGKLVEGDAKSKAFRVERHLVCLRCGARRIETWSLDRRTAFAEKVKNRYEYPEGYALPRELGVTNREFVQMSRSNTFSAFEPS